MARLSRRKVVAALGSAPLLADGKVTAAVAADPVLLLCAHYGELARRQELLMRQWGDREAWLGDNRDWFNLSKPTSEPQSIVSHHAARDSRAGCWRSGDALAHSLPGKPRWRR